jgi:hypothetical protein
MEHTVTSAREKLNSLDPFVADAECEHDERASLSGELLTSEGLEDSRETEKGVC